MEISVILDNIRSCHNVGSILRTAEGFGAKKVFMTGITPYPKLKNDPRLPYIAENIDKKIQKTALNAQKSIDWEYTENLENLIRKLKNDGVKIIGLEISDEAIDIRQVQKPKKIAILLGSETDGISQNILSMCDTIAKINMPGNKESFNVSIAGAVAIYEFRR